MIENLIKDLKESALRPVYYFYGEEVFLRDYYLEKIERKVLGERIEGINYENLQLPAQSLQTLISSANTIPFFGEKKLIVVREGELISKEKHFSAAEIRSLEAYLENPNPSTCLVFLGETEGKGFAKSKIYQWIHKGAHSRAIEYKKLKGAALGNWIRDSLKEKGLHAEPAALDMLIPIGERGLYDLHNELEKIVLSAEGAQITGRIVEEMISHTPEGKIFELIDAIIGRKGMAALSLLDDYLYSGQPPILLRTMLVSSFRRLLMIQDALHEGYVKGAFREYLDTTSDFLIDKSIRQVKQIPAAELLGLYRALYRLEFASRSTKQDPAGLLRDFVTAAAFPR